MKQSLEDEFQGKNSQSRDMDLYEFYSKFISSTYPSFLKKFGLIKTAKRAEGSVITDSSGKNYIDCVGGYGLFNIGHNHPKIIRDIITQLNKKQLFTKPLITEIQVRLAKLLSEIAPGDLNCSFICNSGSEAIDNAIKLARLQSGKKQIITAENSFHGYTFGALSATGILPFKRLFGPMVSEIIHVPFGDVKALKNAITPDTSAVLLEPVQHEAGIAIPPSDYFHEVRRICNDNRLILIFDEIKTGFGKMGCMFACEDLGIVPDILVVGKSLGGGIIPIGALIAHSNLWKKFSLSFPMSASSFAGNTIACQAALSTIEVLQKDNLLADCKKKGDFFIQELKKIVKKYPDILKDVKGKGLLLGLDVVNSKIAFKLSKEIISRGVIVLPAYGNQTVIMIEPPIVISFEQIRTVLDVIDISCKRIKLSYKG
jgi:putrescine aminotransferase